MKPIITKMFESRLLSCYVGSFYIKKVPDIKMLRDVLFKTISETALHSGNIKYLQRRKWWGRLITGGRWELCELLLFALVCDI